MEVLHIANKPAFPLRDGGCIAIKSMLKSLLSKKSFNVYHFTLATHKHPFNSSDYPEGYKKRMELESYFLNTTTDLLGAMIHLIKNTSYNISRFEDSKLKERFKELIHEKKFDLVIMESIYLLPYLELFHNAGIKVVVRAHNVEHKIWEELSNSSKNPLKKWYLKKLSQQLKKYEFENVSKTDAILAITEDDNAFFKEHFPSVPSVVIPTSLKFESIIQDYTLTDFYFLGAMDWLPNKEGISWLLEEVVTKKELEASIHLAGKSMDTAAFEKKSVVCHGEIENAKEFINSHGICLIPLLSGSGLKIKLLENMALGKPIITTSEGARGVAIENGEHVLIADTPKDFQDAMQLLSTDQMLRKKLGESAQNYVKEHFSEHKITNKLLEFLSKV